MDQAYWDKVDQILKKQATFILSQEEGNRIKDTEQRAYERNFDEIRTIIEEFQTKLHARGFVTELQFNSRGFLFRYRRARYYGPAGFRSDFHVEGRLILSQLDPADDADKFMSDSDPDKNAGIGMAFDSEQFKKFLCDNLDRFLDASNLITTKERRRQLRDLQREE